MGDNTTDIDTSNVANYGDANEINDQLETTTSTDNPIAIQDITNHVHVEKTSEDTIDEGEEITPSPQLDVKTTITNRHQDTSDLSSASAIVDDTSNEHTTFSPSSTFDVTTLPQGNTTVSLFTGDNFTGNDYNTSHLWNIENVDNENTISDNEHNDLVTEKINFHTFWDYWDYSLDTETDCDVTMNELISYTTWIENSIAKQIIGNPPDEIRAEACDYIENTKCFECDDNPVLCHGYGTCCDYLTKGNNLYFGNVTEMDEKKFISNSSHTNVTLPPGFLREYNNNVICNNVEYSNYLMIRNCPLDFPRNETRNLCEEHVPVAEITMDTVTVVTDKVLGLTYFNMYCALCNGVNDVLPWTVLMDCSTYVHVMSARDDTEFIRLGMRETSTCKVEQRPPTKAKRCDPRFYKDSRHVISSCKSHREEESSIPRIETECMDQPMDIMRRVIFQDKIFKNVYCLLCNLEYYRNSICLWRRNVVDHPHHYPKTVFTFLFGFNNKRDADKSMLSSDAANCTRDEWPDPQGECQKVLCTAGKILKENRCVTAMDQIKGLPYRLGFWLLPSGPSKKGSHLHLKQQIHFVQKELRNMMQNVSDKMKMTVGALWCGNDDDSQISHVMQSTKSEISFNNQTIITHLTNTGSRIRPNHPGCPERLPHFGILFWVEAYIESHRSLSRDETESTISNLFNNTSIYIESLDVFFIPQLMHGDFSTSNMTEICKKTGTESCYVSKFGDVLSLAIANFIAWHQMLVCPYVEIPEDRVKSFASREGLLSSLLTYVQLQFGHFKVEFSESFEFDQIYKTPGKQGTFYICRDLMDSAKLRGPSFTMEEDDIHALSLYVLSNVVISASLVCLLATVYTYCLFPSLRCMAGWNTLGLSSSFIVAQMVTLIASNLEYGTFPAPVCIFLGISTHYSWLVVFTWSFLCCLHMLRVFTASVRRVRGDKQAERMRKLRNVVISLLIPALIVAMVITISHLMHGGSRIGYGHWRCLYDSVWTLYAPLIVVTLCNVIFFTIVVIKIKKVQRLQANSDFRKEDRKYIIVYIKLSTVTGAFWFLTMAAEIFDSNILRYSSTLINGSQGVFLFSSFIFNRRVLGLYARRYKCLAFVEKESTQDSSSPSPNNLTSQQRI